MKTFQKLLLALCSLALSTGTSLAITLTERPAFSDYTNAVVLGTWCGKAVEERGIAVGDSTAFLPKVSSQQGIVVQVKQNIQLRYPSYVKPVVTNMADILSSYGVGGLIWTNDNHFTDFCGLPRGILTNTLYFTLQNPSESNGWLRVRSCLTDLTTVMDTSLPVGGSNCVYVEWSGYSLNSFSDAYNDAVSSSSITNNLGSAGSLWVNSYVWGDENDGTYYIGINRYQSDVYWSVSPVLSSVTNYDSSSFIYAKTADLSYYWDAYYDTQGDTVSTNYLLMKSWARLKGDSTGPTFPMGDVSVYSPCPHYDHITPDGLYQGWMLADLTVIHDFAASGLANGFQYK